MTFRDDDGNEIETSGEIAMTKQSVSFFNSKIKGDFSTTFQIDNNSVNRKTLGYKGPQMLNQIAYTKQAFSRVRNGNILDRGYIVIQSDNGPTLSCFYVSGNSNWVQLLEGLITELDFTGIASRKDYSVLLNSTNVISAKSSEKETVFPLVDWAYNYNKGGDEEFNLADGILDSSHNFYDFPLYDPYPCFYLHSLVDEILSQSGFKKNGNLFDDGLYKSIVITPVNGLMKREAFKNIIAYGTNQAFTLAGGLAQYTSLTSISSSFVNDAYTSPINCLTYFEINLWYNTGNTNLYIYKNGISIESLLLISLGVTAVSYTLLKGDVITFYAETIDSDETIRFDVTVKIPENISINDYVYPSHFLPPLSSLDVIKFCINFLGCSVYFNDVSKTFSFNIVERINLTDSYDWSAYYVTHKSKYTVDQAQNNYIKWEKNETNSDIIKYNSENLLGFGNGNIETGNTFKVNNTISQLPFQPSPFGLTKSGFYKANVPLVNLVDDGDAIPYTAISDSSGIERYAIASGHGIIANEIVRISNSDNTNLGYRLVYGVGAAYIEVYTAFLATGTGFIRKQKIVYQDVGPRILVNYPSKNVWDYSQSSSFRAGSLVANQSTWPMAYFTKQEIGLGIDQYQSNLSIDNPNVTGFNDPTIKELYFNKISRFLQNPDIEAIMILPEAVFQRFIFDRFIYLETEQLIGYFFVKSIENYIDSNTPVTVNLYML